MSRSGYSDDCENYGLWMGTIAKAVGGKRGQAFLKELIESLEAMPEKKLIAHELHAKTGEVCAIGSVGLKRGVDMSRLDPEDPFQVARVFGISTALAQEIVYQNDERFERQTPEERWARMHAWAKDKLKSEHTQ